jgi:hypothetical protein
MRCGNGASKRTRDDEPTDARYFFGGGATWISTNRFSFRLHAGRRSIDEATRQS